MKFIVALTAIPATALALVSCSETAEPEAEAVEEAPRLTPETVTDADCSADRFQDMIGEMLNDDTFAEIKEVNPNAQAYSEGATPLSPGFDGERITLELDQYRYITDIYCG